MTKTEYAQYLQSDHWQKLRKERIEDYPYCEECQLPRWLAQIAYDQDLHVHHENYRKLGNEDFEDLTVLCRRCHEVETFGRSDLRALKSAECEHCHHTHWNPYENLCEYCRRIPEGGRYMRSFVLPYVDHRLVDYYDMRMPGRADKATVAIVLLVNLWCTYGTDQILDILGDIAKTKPHLDAEPKPKFHLVGPPSAVEAILESTSNRSAGEPDGNN